MEFQNEALSGIEEDQKNGNIFGEDSENEKWLSEDEINLQQVRNNIRNQTWVAADNE